MLAQLLHRTGEFVSWEKVKTFVNLKGEVTGDIFCHLETTVHNLICTLSRLGGLLSESAMRKVIQLL